jgi:hypothetical protein
MKMGGSKPDVCIAVYLAKAGPVFRRVLKFSNSLIALGNIKFRNFFLSIVYVFEQKLCAMQQLKEQQLLGLIGF